MGEIIKMDPILSKRDRIYKTVKRTIAGNTDLTIQAGWNLDVPNHYEILQAVGALTTDVTVANRYIRMQHWIDGFQIAEWTADAIAASTSNGLIISHFMYDDAGYPNNLSNRISIRENQFIIAGDDYFKFYVSGGVAGDSLVIMLQLLWLNDKFCLQKPELFEKGGYPE